MKASELRELSMEELKDKLVHLKEDHFNLKFQHATGQLENPMRLPETKKDIARIMSVLREKELAQ
jgi:large subunit ribosomal protein L29